MLAWQFSFSPTFQRSSRAQRAAVVADQVIREDPRVDMVQVRMEFPRPSPECQNILLGTVYVERKTVAEQSTETIEQDLSQEIQRQILDQGYYVTPLITVTVLDPPGRETSR